MVDVGLLGGLLNLLLGHDPAVVPVGDVLGDAAVEQDGLLRHDAHLCSEPLDIQVLHFFSVNELKSRVHRSTSGQAHFEFSKINTITSHIKSAE